MHRTVLLSVISLPCKSTPSPLCPSSVAWCPFVRLCPSLLAPCPLQTAGAASAFKCNYLLTCFLVSSVLEPVFSPARYYLNLVDPPVLAVFVCLVFWTWMQPLTVTLITALHPPFSNGYCGSVSIGCGKSSGMGRRMSVRREQTAARF